MSTIERQTKQKEVVEDYLSSTCCHPSAEKVYDNVKEELPSISKATVYRILRNFKDKGKIQEIPTKVSRWDYNHKPHPHFICTECDKIIDIADEFSIPDAEDLNVGEISTCRIVFCGLCKDCKN
ncbi:MAG: Fur family transcriptional regulator [Patescibacteria group bacterium]